MNEWNVIHIDETDSTNRWLKSRLTAVVGSADNHHATELGTRAVVVADYQTAGRGCGTNTWESERGANLLFSLLIHPTSLPANRQFHISMAVSVAIVNTLSSILSPLAPHPLPLSIKWPNDIYVGDRKICGILIENQLQGGCIKDSIIGVGLNVNQQHFVSDAPNPVSLANLTGRLLDRELLLQQLLEAFDTEWTHLEGVRSRYLPLLYRRTGFHCYRDALSEFSAELLTVEDDGHLLLRNTDGHDRRYAFKEVQFVI